MDERYRELKNGAIYDMEAKRIVSNPGGGKSAITQANASVLASRRWELARERAAAGIAAGVGLALDDQPTEAMFYIGKHAVEVYQNTKSARGLAELGRFIMQSAGWGEESSKGAGANVRIDNVNVLGVLVRDVVDGELVEE